MVELSTQAERGATGDAVRALWLRLREGVIGRLATIDRAVLALLEDRLDDELRREAEREAHKLTGSVGTFGFAEGSRLARRLESAFEPGNALQAADAMTLADLAVALRRELETEPRAAGPVQPSPELPELAARRLVILAPDREVAERLTVEAVRRGMQPEVASDAAAAARLVQDMQPAVVIFHIVETDRAVERLLRSAAKGGERRIVLIGADTFDMRLFAARLGVHVYLPAPVAPARALDAALALDEVSAARAGSRILAVDDDPAVLAAMRTLLEPQGYDITTVSDPAHFWTVLEDTAPDLIIVDVDMPHVSGVDICRAVRNDMRWNRVPIVVLTARADTATVERAFAAGADDFIMKPLRKTVLRGRIAARLQRFRLHQRLLELEDVSGAASRVSAQHNLERLIGVAARTGERVALALVQLDAAREPERLDRAGSERVQRHVGSILHRMFADEHVVAHWGDASFIIGMYGLGRDTAVARLEAALRRLRSDDAMYNDGGLITCSAGVVQFPDDGGDLASLGRAAGRVLGDARAAGGDRVAAFAADARASAAEHVDVLVVEDDEALAELLLHTLRTRGYTTCWLSDGQTAIDRLAADEPTLVARAILLDVGLPGRDGLSVLRALNRRGLARAMRIIMLTARSAEAEVLKALELGAADHIAKPFSVPVLMERLRRALESMP